MELLVQQPFALLFTQLRPLSSVIIVFFSKHMKIVRVKQTCNTIIASSINVNTVTEARIYNRHLFTINEHENNNNCDVSELLFTDIELCLNCFLFTRNNVKP